MSTDVHGPRAAAQEFAPRGVVGFEVDCSVSDGRLVDVARLQHAGVVELGHGALGAVAAANKRIHASCMSNRMAPGGRMTRRVLGKMYPHVAGAAVESPCVTRSRPRLVDQILRQWAWGKAVKARTSALASPVRGRAEEAGRERLAAHLEDRRSAPVRRTRTGRRWSGKAEGRRRSVPWARGRHCGKKWTGSVGGRRPGAAAQPAHEPACWSKRLTATPRTGRAGLRMVRTARQGNSSSLSPTSRTRISPVRWR